LTVNAADLLTPPAVPEIVTDVAAVTVLVVTVNVALVAPAATVTLAGTVATAVLLLVSVTTVPPAGAAALKVTVPVEELPPVTLVGLSVSVQGVTAVGFTVKEADFVVPLLEAVIVTAAHDVTDWVATVNVALVAPAATVTLAGTVATAVLLLVSVTTVPPVGAAPVKVTVPVEEAGPTTLVGFTDTDDKLAAAGAACGLKRRVAENGPNTPAEFCARTRHHNRCAGRPPMVACDTVTVWFAINGAAMVEVLSTWIS
jgi:hypothetical protein